MRQTYVEGKLARRRDFVILLNGMAPECVRELRDLCEPFFDRVIGPLRDQGGLESDVTCADLVPLAAGLLSPWSEKWALIDPWLQDLAVHTLVLW